MLSSGMLHGDGKQGHDHSAHHDRYHEPSFRLPVGLELSGKRAIGKVLELAPPDELGESSSSDTLEVARARSTQRFIGRRVASSKGLREIAPAPDGSCHQKE